MNGLLNVAKPPGMTSHDVVGYLRRVTGVKRVGHAGTLDPGAAGVLVVAVGRATRILEYLQALAKSYCGEIVFGCATASQDAEGEVTETSDAPGPAEGVLRSALTRFVGQGEQVPPMVSAVKHRGKRLYQYAREGEDVVRQPRTVSVRLLELLEYDPGPPALGRLVVECSGGTYVRTLCADIGVAVGVPAHMGFLVRTAVGPFRIAESHTLESLAEAGESGALDECLLPPAEALTHLPKVNLDSQAAERVRHGATVPSAAPSDDAADSGAPCCAFDQTGALLAVGAWDASAGTFRPRKVLVAEGGDAE